MKKVTAKQLMIGDWVRYNGKYEQVKGLSPYFQKIAILNRSQDIDDVTYLFIKSATPIPITEEWLIWNGFDLMESTHSYLNKVDMADIYYTCSSMDLEIDMLDGYYTSHPIQYIHQLQQAYRLATGKELKVKF